MAVEIVTIDDIRKAGHCTAGARTWFGLHDLDFRDFMRNGIEASVLLALPDNGLAIQVIERKRARENG